MAQAPKRPVRLVFSLGRGARKGRRDSDNPTRYTVEAVSLAIAEGRWEASKQMLAERVKSDVRAELVSVAGEFRRHVIGAPANQRGLVGTLRSRAKSINDDRVSLGTLPRWAPRDAKYLERKRDATGNNVWFDNTGWNDEKWPAGSGTLRNFFASKSVDMAGGGSMAVGSGGIFEELFGGVEVQVTRNNQGTNPQGSIRLTNNGKKAEVQLGTIRVRALGKITDEMLRISDRPNEALLGVVAEKSRDVALRLRGGRGRYRPTLEPYLAFFLRRAIPQAVVERLRKGEAMRGLFK